MAREPDEGWICCQLGAREHFAVPRALHASGRLAALLTDAWVPPGSPAALLSRRLSDRHHPDLARARVCASNARLLAFEAASAVAGSRGWDRMVRRNRWFEERVVDHLARLAGSGARRLFSYGHTALGPFEWARPRGWRTALGQIDPGPAEERLVRALNERHAALAGPWRPAPPAYWEAWRRECELADVVVVNSRWSRQSLVAEGVEATRIRVVPLAYDPPAEASTWRREYPARFGTARPLRMLFLGQLALRKGMAEILEAMQRLDGAPVEFRFVGPLHMSLPAAARARANARWIGPVARSEAARHYRECDAFLFPTHSDGFGLTQLEAQAWGLPIIASRFCGEVVRDGVDGVVLAEVTADAIAAAVHAWVEDPARLASLARAAASAPRHPVARLGARLLEAIEG